MGDVTVSRHLQVARALLSAPEGGPGRLKARLKRWAAAASQGRFSALLPSSQPAEARRRYARTPRRRAA
eukprot:scaffold46259_cov43-Phaeocystis_antarctica.AAC.1